jgi:molybdopterin converting factor subunit 1
MAGSEQRGTDAPERIEPGAPADSGRQEGGVSDLRVEVLLFAQAREAAGTSALTLVLPRGASVGDATGRLASTCPRLAPHLERCSFAVNKAYAPRERILEDEDELAVIPPIGGG